MTLSVLALLWHALSGSTSRYLPIAAFLALVGLVFYATAALAQSPSCSSTETVERLLRGKYGEHVYDEYLSGGRLYQLWVNFAERTGSLVVTHASGISCIVLPLEGMLPARRVKT